MNVSGGSLNAGDNSFARVTHSQNWESPQKMRIRKRANIIIICDTVNSEGRKTSNQERFLQNRNMLW